MSEMKQILISMISEGPNVGQKSLWKPILIMLKAYFKFVSWILN